MRSAKRSHRVRRLVAASAASAIVVLGSAGVATAQTAPDQHSGGVASDGGSTDPGVKVGGTNVSRGSSALPVTGSDIAGMLALGAGAVAVGSAAIVTSRRRAANAAT